MFSIQQRFYLPTKVASMEQFWALVRAPHTAKLVAEARAALAKDDKATYDKKKKQLPLVIFVGTFDESEKEVENKKTGEKRKMKGRWRNQANVNLNGLVVADYDHLDGDVLDGHVAQMALNVTQTVAVLRERALRRLAGGAAGGVPELDELGEGHVVDLLLLLLLLDHLVKGLALAVELGSSMLRITRSIGYNLNGCLR